MGKNSSTNKANQKGGNHQTVDQSASLKPDMTEEHIGQRPVLWVNWLTKRGPVDFTEVAIAQATDQEVEQLAIRLGNDTDPARRDYYRQMLCTVWSDCTLSENSLRILKRTFERVVRQNKLSGLASNKLTTTKKCRS